MVTKQEDGTLKWLVTFFHGNVNGIYISSTCKTVKKLEKHSFIRDISVEGKPVLLLVLKTSSRFCKEAERAGAILLQVCDEVWWYDD